MEILQNQEVSPTSIPHQHVGPGSLCCPLKTREHGPHYQQLDCHWHGFKDFSNTQAQPPNFIGIRKGGDIIKGEDVLQSPTLGLFIFPQICNRPIIVILHKKLLANHHLLTQNFTGFPVFLDFTPFLS